jgi:hypothetical protein
MNTMDQSLYTAINTTNGVESLNRLFKYTFLPKAADKSFTSVMKVMVETYCPEAHKKYAKSNVKSTGQFKTTNKMVPTKKTKVMHERMRELWWVFDVAQNLNVYQKIIHLLKFKL